MDGWCWSRLKRIGPPTTLYIHTYIHTYTNIYKYIYIFLIFIIHIIMYFVIIYMSCIQIWPLNFWIFSPWSLFSPQVSLQTFVNVFNDDIQWLQLEKLKDMGMWCKFWLPFQPSHSRLSSWFTLGVHRRAYCLHFLQSNPIQHCRPGFGYISNGSLM